MADTAQAVNSLLLIAYIAPVAVYFLFLGLVNSHARPCLISGRTDFVALTCVLAPLLIAPLPALARGGLGWLIVVGAVLAVWGFCSMLPGRREGWVIYNVSAPRGRALVEACIRDLGWSGNWNDDAWAGECGRVYLTSIPILRNVTVHLDLHPEQADRRIGELGDTLSNRLARVEQLPSTSGACMVILGVGLLVLPLWMMGRHIQDVVEAVVHLFG